ncbi:hypothetical protein THAOC_11944 [Thalassiosira oceanica]|uniref:Uncharacterized protein n=1 Tax=Thalassiosira oceanica TaxID=159749 RepID=K0T1B2_THAOC|nr:hypothetical protein THAOC_11944 [Thalassiosira oceanica]|eukprot:EJK67066.1 hypothetical protein THAOC_11944 [Thalassiosira oceanica]
MRLASESSSGTDWYSQANTNLALLLENLDTTISCLAWDSPRSSKALSDLANTRYLRDRIIRKPSTNVFEEDLRVEEDGTHWMNDNEFLNKYRMDRETLDAVTEMIEDHPVFKRGRRGRRQRPVKHQLMTLLHFLGKEGETNLSQRNTLKIGAGSAEKY